MTADEILTEFFSDNRNHKLIQGMSLNNYCRIRKIRQEGKMQSNSELSIIRKLGYIEDKPATFKKIKL